MIKNYFYNYKLNYKDKDKIKLTQTPNVVKKSVVDINILLNKVKIEKKNKTKKSIIFFSLVTLALILFGTFIAIL